MLLDFLGLCPGHQARKIDAPFVIARCVGTLDITELALKAEIDDLFYFVGFYFLGIDFGVLAFSAIVVDGIEHFGKATAEFNAHAAIGAHAEYALDFRAQILLVIIARIGRVIGVFSLHGILSCDANRICFGDGSLLFVSRKLFYSMRFAFKSSTLKARRRQ